MRQFLISEPYNWLQRCFFQPMRFKQEFDSRALPERLIIMLRLTIILFLYAFTPAMVMRIIIFTLRPDFYPHYMINTFTPFSSTVGWFLFDALWATALSCLMAALIGGLFSVRFGIAASFALALANGIIVNTDSDILVGIVFGIGFGLMLGIAFNSANVIKRVGLENATVASMLGIIGGLVIGFLAATTGGYWMGYVFGTIYPALQDESNILGSTAGLIVGGVLGCLIAALAGFILARSLKEHKEAVSFGTNVCIAVAAAFGLALGIPVGDRGISHDTFANGLVAGITEDAIVCIGFLLFYLLSYYRLPLYPVSAYSTIQAYLASQRKQRQALYCLRHSSLHWDECVFLPLPYLKSMLLLASEQSLDGTLEEMNYILQEKPQQRWAVQAVAYELALSDLQDRKVLRDIGQAHLQLAVFLPQQIRVLNASAEKVFRSLDDASREAASYHMQTNKSDRQTALEHMIFYLKSIHPSAAFSTSRLNRHLQHVVNQWTMLAEQGIETLGSISGSLYIDNPYAPGNPLRLRDPLFVGRNDVAQKLGQALQRRYRPTFLLTGERRIGKSSILRQLPVLLGPRYFPVFFDLQSPGLLASVVTLFDAIAHGIVEELKERGIQVQPLERDQLHEALQQSETAVYARFGQWLAEIERVLEQEERIIILAFDEFEKLEEAESRGSINLVLLFDWFRSIIQNHLCIALLFSGAKMVGDMGLSWAGYFVNVEIIKVGFLRNTDAYNLIVKPVPNVFTEEVAGEIMRITRCHPFLIQAICKQIIEQLNNAAREQDTPEHVQTVTQATLENVHTATKEVFESWMAYFWDLWNRCDREQRECIMALLSLKQADVVSIAQWAGLDRQKALYALEKLLMRDIVTQEKNLYQLAVPMFAQWIEQNHQLPPSTDRE